jgi:hypothetical protein
MGEQIRVMKQLVATEVADLKQTMQAQVAEVKQVAMYQDRVYQERIRRLEMRVEQLSEFCLHLAKSTGSTGALRILPPELLNADAADEAAAAASGRAAALSSTVIDDDDLPEEPQGVAGVQSKYASKLDAMYTYYTTSNIQVFHPAMTLPHFTRMLRDCRLCEFGSGTSAELLWMAVLRHLGKKRRRRQANLRNATTLVTGKAAGMSGKRTVDLFAQERLDEIPHEAFPDALFYLSVERFGKFRADLAPDRAFESFLLTNVFPFVDAALETHHAALHAVENAVLSSRDPTAATNPVAAYKTEAVRTVVKDYMAKIRNDFRDVAAKANNGRETEFMALDGFVEFVRTHDLMPLISKPDLRQIFVACSALEKAKNPSAPADTVSLPGLIGALYHLAERIYGDPLFADKYPDPEARIRKLLSKMFLLK